MRAIDGGDNVGSRWWSFFCSKEGKGISRRLEGPAMCQADWAAS